MELLCKNRRERKEIIYYVFCEQTSEEDQHVSRPTTSSIVTAKV